jgi:hypothetical protein
MSSTNLLLCRCGAFQHLAQAALQQFLPPEVPPAAARCALTAVIRRTLDAPGTFDGDGWLQVGLCGHQPGLGACVHACMRGVHQRASIPAGEEYISTGSLYLATTAFLPLGLPPSHAFWADPDAPWTAKRVWNGDVSVQADHALDSKLI